MSVKQLLCPDRLRRPPRQFSWIDQRLVSDKHLKRLPHASQALYLFLATVADKRGLSFYSDRSVCSHLNMSPHDVVASRQHLIEAGLIAYRRPLYQVLSLDGSQLPLALELPRGELRRPSKPTSLGAILSQIARKESKA